MGDIQRLLKEGEVCGVITWVLNCNKMQDSTSTSLLLQSAVRHASGNMLHPTRQTLGFLLEGTCMSVDFPRDRRQLAYSSWCSVSGHCIPPALTLKDDPQQSPDRPHLLGLFLWVQLPCLDRVLGKLAATAKPVRYLALVDGVDQVVDVHMNGMESLLFAPFCLAHDLVIDSTTRGQGGDTTFRHCVMLG